MSKPSNHPLAMGMTAEAESVLALPTGVSFQSAGEVRNGHGEGIRLPTQSSSNHP
jgi:hypothetical protein